MKSLKKILIYAGTTEGRTLAEKLAERGIKSDVSVATEYGNQGYGRIRVYPCSAGTA